MNYKEIINKNLNKYFNEFEEYIAFPSVSGIIKHKKDIQNCAVWLKNRMSKAGLKNVKLINTAGNPIVFGEYFNSKNAPTLMIYGHYDVQSPDPLNQWKSDPFKLKIEKNRIFGRGVADNKGPNLTHIIGFEILNKFEKIPVNIKFIYEGEEETSSPNFASFVKLNKKLVKSDLALVCDGEMDFENPVVEYGLRGICHFEIDITCLEKDVHSGLFGGNVDNAAIVLSWIISQLKDRNGKILIPGIYSKVRKIDKKESVFLKKSEIKDEEIIQNTGARKLFGEKGYLNVVRMGARPSLDVHGMYSGYIGEGGKTIIPSKANAKISIRLVPNLEANYVKKQIINYINKIAPKTCKVEISKFEGVDPVLFDFNSKKFDTGLAILKNIFNKEPKLKLIGGSIGAVTSLDKISKIQSFSTGFSLPDAGMHSPNENFLTENFKKSIYFTIEFIKNFTK